MDMLKKAIELVQDAYYADYGIANHMRTDAAIYAQIAIARELRALNGLLKAHWGYFGGEESAPNEPPSDNASADTDCLLDEDEIQRMLRF